MLGPALSPTGRVQVHVVGAAVGVLIADRLNVAGTDIGHGLAPVSFTGQQGAKSDAEVESIVRSPASRSELIMYVPLGR